jgi:hypothetical protein
MTKENHNRKKNKNKKNLQKLGDRIWSSLSLSLCLSVSLSLSLWRRTVKLFNSLLGKTKEELRKKERKRQMLQCAWKGREGECD